MCDISIPNKVKTNKTKKIVAYSIYPPNELDERNEVFWAACKDKIVNKL